MFIGFSSILFAQKGVIINGAELQINDSSFFKVENGGHFIIKDEGKIDLEGTITVSGDWDNQNTNSDIWLNQSNGLVELKGQSQQTIWNTTHFKNLHILNTEGVILDDELEVDNLNISDDGLLQANGQNINIFGNWNSLNGTFVPEGNHVYFMGDSDQEISSENSQMFYDMTINNGNKVYFNNTLGIKSLYITSGNAEAASNANIDTRLVYNGTDLQQTGDEWPAVTSFDVIIENNSMEGVNLNSSKVIGLGKTVTVEGNLRLNTDTITGLGNFVVEPGAVLATKHALGLDGNLQMNGTTALSQMAAYEYNGTVNQQTGNLLPDTVAGLTINNTAPGGNVLLTQQGLITINGLLRAENGSFTVNPEAQITVNGNTHLNAANGLVLKSDATGTASFIDNGIIIGPGSAIVEDYLRTEAADLGRYISVPISNANSNMFQNPAAGLWVFNTSAPSPQWEAVLGNTNLDNMTGYVTRYPGEKTIAFTGSLNTGEISRLNLVRTPNNFGWNLIGNPYPSAFEWEDASLFQVNNAIYFRKANGTVASYVNMIGTNGASSIIPPMQSFWVQVNIDYNSGHVILDNAGRLHSAQPLFKAPANHQLIRLMVDNNYATDETVVYFADDAQAFFDGHLDAYKLQIENINLPSICSFTDTHEELSINAIPFTNDPISVPIGYKSQNIGIHQITAYDFDNIAPNVSIHLEDLALNTIQNLRNNNTYQFTHNSNSIDNRFVLHFNYMALQNNELSDVDQNEFLDIYSSGNNVFVNFPVISDETYKINIYNVLGQLIFNETLSHPESLHKIQLEATNGYYIVNIATNSHNWVKKINLFR